MTNMYHERSAEVKVDFQGFLPKGCKGRILTAPTLNAHNTFDRPDQVALLQELDCTYGQGHYFAYPQDAAAAGSLLEEPGAAALGQATGDASRPAHAVPATPSKPEAVA